jgi:hypothetical protein
MRTSIAPLPATVSRAVVGSSRTASMLHPAGSFSSRYACDTSTAPNPRTTPFPVRAKHSTALGIPAGHVMPGYDTSSSVWKLSAPTSAVAGAARTSPVTATATAHRRFLVFATASARNGNALPRS